MFILRYPQNPHRTRQHHTIAPSLFASFLQLHAYIHVIGSMLSVCSAIKEPMSYLVRVTLPDLPGSLGELAEAFGVIDANIQSVDIVETDPSGTVTDDIVVSLPTGTMVDVLITAASAIDGVEVDSIRPFTGRVDRSGHIRMLAKIAELANKPKQALDELTVMIPQAMTSSWAVVLEHTPEGLDRLCASQAAPEDDQSHPIMPPLEHARVLVPDNDTWTPESWWQLDTALAITPLGASEYILVVGRIGGPDFLASEVAQIGDLGTIIGSIIS